MPSELEKLRAKRRAAIKAVVDGVEEYDEKTPIHLVQHFDLPRPPSPTLPDSDSPPPSNSVSLKGPSGWGAKHVHQWVFALLGFAAILVAGIAYVVGQIVSHPRPDAVPITAPSHP